MPGGAMSLRRQLVGEARLAPFPERQAVAGIDRAKRGTSDLGEYEPGDPVLAGLLGNLQRRHVPASPAGKRIGRFQPAASANIRSAPAAHAGKVQISGAHTAQAVGRRSRYPQVGWLVWATGRGSITRSAT
jgi:hypothetical protein